MGKDPVRTYGIAKQIRAGNNGVNGGAGDRSRHGPFGGYKQSGLGREWGIFASKSSSNTKQFRGRLPRGDVSCAGPTTSTAGVTHGKLRWTLWRRVGIDPPGSVCRRLLTCCRLVHPRDAMVMTATEANNSGCVATASSLSNLLMRSIAALKAAM